MSDDFDVGNQTPRPVPPVGFALAQQWEAHRDETVEHTVGAVDTVAGVMGNNGGNDMGNSQQLLTKSEAILLAKLLVAYPFLVKVL